MNDFDKKIADVFDVAPLNEPEKKKPLAVHYNEPDLGQDLTDAYQQSKENLQDIIDQGKDAMEAILEIAKQGQHPRAFEVFGTILKNMTDANKELLNIQKQMRDIENNKKGGGTNIDKAIFIGSTADLQKMLKDKNGS